MSETRIERRDGRTFFMGKPMPVGPWDAEPDHVDFDSDGIPCILHRGPLGAWCGYIAVPPGHPWHGKPYGEVRVVPTEDRDEWPDVHGGLTYSESCAGAICHVPKPGESDDVWWLGFDCNHSGDLSLFDYAHRSDLTDFKFGGGLSWTSLYRDLAYVRRETERLAEQAAVANKR